ncbi:UNVERIFIED_ORG: hypothetical protein ABIB21_002801 [Arthrobacter sp. UYEF13]
MALLRGLQTVRSGDLPNVANAVAPEGPERLSDHVSLGVLTRVFPADVVGAVVERTGALEQRNRLLPSRLMVYYVMALALFSNGSYEEVMRSLLAGMEWLTGRFREWTMPTKAGIYKARNRLGSAVMVALFAEVAKPFAVPGGPGFYLQGPGRPLCPPLGN